MNVGRPLANLETRSDTLSISISFVPLADTACVAACFLSSLSRIHRTTPRSPAGIPTAVMWVTIFGKFPLMRCAALTG
jgi:hypothetical protein